MSREIEERVVQMRFDNKQFESGVSETLGTLDKLKKSLKFDGATKGLENLSDSAEKVNFNPIGTAVDAISSKFTALEAIAAGAFFKIGGYITDFGKKILDTATVMSELNPANIVSGWGKFSSKTTSVGTLVSQGYDIDHVNDLLAKLNWYTDETSYNFTDMVANISKFTAAGQDLDDSVAAMEGIANWAAMSGQNAMTASRAMIQLSQAMSKGAMRYDDWKSIQNVSMDTQQFRQIALDAAVAAGTLKKVGEDAYQSLVNNKGTFGINEFTNHLTEDAWFTSEVMMDVYRKYAEAVEPIYAYAESHGITASEAIKQLEGDLDEFAIAAFKAAQEARTWTDVVDSVKDAVSTGWSNTFQIIFGDYEEAKALWTDLANTFYDIFAGGAAERNAFLFTGLSSGWKQFIAQGIPDAEKFKGLLEYIIRESNEPLFSLRETENGSIIRTETNLDELIKTHGSFVGAMEEGIITSDMLAAAVDSMAEAYNGLTEEERKSAGVSELDIQQINELNQQIKDGTINLEEWAKQIASKSGRDYLVESLFNILDALFKIDEETGKAIGVLSVLKQSFLDIFPPMTGERLYAITKRISEFTNRLVLSSKNAEKLGTFFKGFFSIIRSGTGIIGRFLRYGLEKIGIATKDLFGGFNFNVFDFLEQAGNSMKAFSEWLGKEDTFTGAIELLGGAFGKLAEYAGLAKDEVFGWLETLKDFPLVQAVLEGLNTILGDLSTYVDRANPIGAVIGGIADSLIQLKDVNTWTPTTLVESLKNIVGSVTDSLTEVEGSYVLVNAATDAFTDNLGANMFDATENVKSFGNQAVGFFSQVYDAVKKNVGMGQLMTIAAGGLLLRYVKLWSNAATFVGDMLKGFGSVISNLGGSITELFKQFSLVVVAINKVTTAKARELNAKAFKEMTKALLMIVGAIVVIALLWKTHREELEGATLLVAGIMMSLLAMSQMLSAMGPVNFRISAGVKSLFTVAVSLIVAIAALRLLIGAFQSMAKMGLTWEQYSTVALQIAGVIVVMGGLYLMLAHINQYSKTPLSIKNMFALIGSIIALRLMISVLNSLSKTVSKFNGSTIFKVFVSLIAIFGALKLLSAALSGFNLTSSAGLLLMIGSLGLIVLSLKSLAEIDTTTLASALSALIKIMVMVGALIAVSYLAGPNAVGAGAMMIGIGMALSGIAYSVKILSEIKDYGSLAAATAAVVALFAVMGFVISKTSRIGKNAIRAGVMLLMMSGTLIILAGVILILQAIPVADLAPATIAIGSLIAIFALILYASMYARGSEAALMKLAVIIGFVGVLIGALAYFNKDNPAQMQSTVEGLVKVFLSLAALMAALGISAKLAMGLNYGEFIKPLVGAVGAMAAALGALVLLDQYGELKNPDELMLKVAALSAILLALSASMLILAPVAGAVGSAAPATLLGMLTIVVSFGILVAGVIAVFGVIGWALEKLEEVGVDVSALLDNTIIAMEKIGAGIGRFIGALVVGIVTGGIDESLVGFAQAMVDFSEKMAEFDTSSIEAAKSAIGLFTLFTGAELLASVEKFASYWLSGGPLAGLFDAVGEWFGTERKANENPIQQFMEILPKLGEALKNFQNKMGSGVRTERISAGAEAIKTIAEAILPLGRDGKDSVLAVWAGTKDDAWYSFATNLGYLGQGLHAFSYQIQRGFDKKKVVQAAEAGTALAEFAQSIPNEGGWLAAITGDNKLSQFSEYIEQYGDAIIAFNSAFEGDGVSINTATLKQRATDAAEAGKALAGFADSISNLGTSATYTVDAYGGVSKIGGDLSGNLSQFTDFLGLLPEVGEGISAFTSSLGENFESGPIEQAASAVGSLASIISTLYGRKDNIISLNEDNVLGTFASNLAMFGVHFKRYYNYMQGINADTLKAVNDEVERWIKFGKSIEAIDFTRLPPFAKLLAETAKNGVEDFLSMIEDNYSKARAYAATFVQEGINGMQEKAVNIHIAIKGIVAGIEAFCIGEGNEIVPKFYNIGVNFVLGIANGLRDDAAVAEAEAAAKELSEAIELSSKTSLGEESPSKIAREIGAFFAEGMAIGIRDNSGSASQAATQLADAVENAIRKEWDMHSPPRVGIELGSSMGSTIGDSIASGLMSTLDKVKSAASTVTDIARDTLMSGAEKLKNAISSKDGLGGLDLKSLITGGLSEDFLTSMLKDSGFVSQDVKAMLNGTYSGGITGIDLDRYLTSVGIDPVTAGITPVLDLDKAVENADSLNSVMSFWQASGINDRMSEIEQIADSQNGLGVAGNVYQFTQNNYSPKALSREEIYRQTRNQFALMKGTAK